jgi:hypothetical protein
MIVRVFYPWQKISPLLTARRILCGSGTFWIPTTTKSSHHHHWLLHLHSSSTMFALSLESWTPKEATIRIQQQDSLKLYHSDTTQDKRDIVAVQWIAVLCWPLSNLKLFDLLWMKACYCRCMLLTKVFGKRMKRANENMSWSDLNKVDWQILTCMNRTGSTRASIIVFSHYSPFI